ncbi:hypothetical protein G7Y89_g7869 [Cudoniella acicularis]|uniref:Uncharacterized protein n=1 Tax=Cudoniella acicularis TaxID=354080 RepID=A0A8H4RK58_9HELO|nr:hypothetical protein G7Y89_g7869 [Cudoniella acicularis]
MSVKIISKPTLSNNTANKNVSIYEAVIHGYRYKQFKKNKDFYIVHDSGRLEADAPKIKYVVFEEEDNVYTVLKCNHIRKHAKPHRFRAEKCGPISTIFRTYGYDPKSFTAVHKIHKENGVISA